MLVGKGFEIPPRGRLLKQCIELSHEMGIAHERSIGFHKDFHVHDRDILVFPRGICRMKVRTMNPNKTFEITSAHVLFIPEGIEHDDLSLSTVYDTFALLPSRSYVNELCREHRLSKNESKALAEDPIKIRRSRWLDDLVERYFYERVVASSPHSSSFGFLEKQILSEFARIAFDKGVRTNSTFGGDDKGVLSKALRHIESSLFDEIDLKKVSAASGCSLATLLRLFRTSLATSPGAYIKNRRLDEAAHLLERQEHSIGDIAMLVGYNDFSAFCRAFKMKFGSTPSDFGKQHTNAKKKAPASSQRFEKIRVKNS